jgi:hypothetical protein
MRFSADQALEAHEEGEPIMVPTAWVTKVCADHGTTSTDFFLETGAQWPTANGYDAWTVLEWLGY